MCVISAYKGRRILGILKDGSIEDIIAADNESGFNIGDIIIGKVTETVPNIASAFLDLGGVKGYLSLKEGNAVRPGMEIPVQIVKEAAGEKDMTVTSRLSLAGRYTVVSLPASRRPAVRISGRIEDHIERERLKGIGESLLNTYDITLRTRAEAVSEALIISEAEELSEKLRDIIARSEMRTPFSRLYSKEDPFVITVRDCRFGNVSGITTDLPEIYELMLKSFPDIEIKLYKDDMLKLIKLHKIESTIESVFDRRVWLKSGAYLIIDRTEAMNVIDVNSGKVSYKSSRADTFLKINLEAVSEAARQIRIRNLSGMILIDFINMKRKEDYLILEARLRDALKYDLTDCSFIDFTGLGIAEIVRRKKRQPLADVLKDING